MIQNTLTKSVETLGGYASIFDLPKGKKSVTIMKQVICITTNEESLDAAKRMNADLMQIHNVELPIAEASLSLEVVKSNFDNINKVLIEVNEMFDTVKNIFDISTSTNDVLEVEIDDDIMLNFLATMEKNKTILMTISDYLSVVIKSQDAQKEILEGHFSKYTLEEVYSLLNEVE